MVEGILGTLKTLPLVHKLIQTGKLKHSEFQC